MKAQEWEGYSIGNQKRVRRHRRKLGFNVKLFIIIELFIIAGVAMCLFTRP